MQKTLLGMLTLALGLVACEKKNDPESFPVTFDHKTIEITKVTKLDSIPGSDSSFSSIKVSASKVSTIQELAYDASGQLKYEAILGFSYNAVKQISSVSYNAPFEQQLNVVYQNGERTLKYTYKNEAAFQWDDSTITYNVPVAESNKPSTATINYYWVNGSAKVAYRQEDHVNFFYSGNDLSRVEIFNRGVVDSIFDPSISMEQTNYDTTKSIVYAADTTQMLKSIYRYTSQGRNSPAQAYFPVHFNGLEHFYLSGSNYPKQIYREDYENGFLAGKEYISFVYINDVVTGEIQTIQEHRSNSSAVVNQANLRSSYYFKNY